MKGLLLFLLVLPLCGCGPSNRVTAPSPQPQTKQPAQSALTPFAANQPPTRPDTPLQPTTAPAPAAPAPTPPSTPAAPATKTEGMNKEEFREKVKTFKNLAPGFRGGRNWNGVNFGPGDSVPGSNAYRTAIFEKRDFYDAFGPPAKTQTKGTMVHWYWKCRDGVVDVYHVASSNPEKVGFMGVDDN
jgi:hypothetical protein